MQPLVTDVHPVARWVSRLWVRSLTALPRRLRAALGRVLGLMAYALGVRRRIALDNLALAFPEIPERGRRRIARAAYVNLAHAGLEALTSTGVPARELESQVRVERWEPFQAALQAGRGVLVATAHFGSWELLGEVMARRGVRLNAVVRPLKGALNAEIMASRVRAGIQLIAPRGAISGVVRAVRRGEVVAVLIDQALPGNKGVPVPFFGRDASTSPALSAAALRTGAPVFVAVGIREGTALRLCIEGPVPLPEAESPAEIVRLHTAALTAVLETYVRRYPEQWLWLHRRWKVGASGFRQMAKRKPAPTVTTG